jgi:tRNA-binding protein
MHITFDPNSPVAETIAFEDFSKIDVRAGTIRECLPFPEARRPSYILMIDFGPTVGVRKSAAQVTARYAPQDLIGKRIMAVVNFMPRQIGPMRSEVLVLGFADEKDGIVLATIDMPVPDGARLA